MHLGKRSAVSTFLAPCKYNLTRALTRQCVEFQINKRSRFQHIINHVIKSDVLGATVTALTASFEDFQDLNQDLRLCHLEGQK